MTALPGLAALVALVFTWRSEGQNRAELAVSEQGQITTRFNESVTNLGSSSRDVRFGGIYALERIMQDSARDQPRVVSVLSAYIRTHAGVVPSDGFAKPDPDPEPATDLTATADVLANRTPAQDGRALVDWNHADLRGLRLTAMHVKDTQAVLKRMRAAGTKSKGPSPSPSPPARLSLSFANFTQTDLRNSVFVGVDLVGAWCIGTNFSAASFQDVDLTDSVMAQANLVAAEFTNSTDLSSVYLAGADLRAATAQPGTKFQRADLRQARMSGAQLVSADLSGADLQRADLAAAESQDLSAANRGAAESLPAANLIGANLTGANLRNAVLRGVSLRGANLAGADFTDADLTGAELNGANCKGAIGLPSPSPCLST
ncbi:pentapeptide repeat-containing protein [Streptomyces virginiae]|uniref:pentapeptide repeat-containing protein n=1 Tax=Streptomyces virginiae TaxID=1961 RepID=UPI00365136F2